MPHFLLGSFEHPPTDRNDTNKTEPTFLKVLAKSHPPINYFFVNFNGTPSMNETKLFLSFNCFKLIFIFYQDDLSIYSRNYLVHYYNLPSL